MKENYLITLYDVPHKLRKHDNYTEKQEIKPLLL